MILAVMKFNAILKIDLFRYIQNSARKRGKRQRKVFLLFLSSLPQYQAEYLIFRKWPIAQRSLKTFRTSTGFELFSHLFGQFKQFMCKYIQTLPLRERVEKGMFTARYICVWEMMRMSSVNLQKF